MAPASRARWRVSSRWRWSRAEDDRAGERCYVRGVTRENRDGGLSADGGMPPEAWERAARAAHAAGDLDRAAALYARAMGAWRAEAERLRALLAAPDDRGDALQRLESSPSGPLEGFERLELSPRRPHDDLPGLDSSSRRPHDDLPGLELSPRRPHDDLPGLELSPRRPHDDLPGLEVSPRRPHDDLAGDDAGARPPHEDHAGDDAGARPPHEDGATGGCEPADAPDTEAAGADPTGLAVGAGVPRAAVAPPVGAGAPHVFAPPVAAGVRRPFVSVCIPTYNRARFLLDAIGSALSQPFADLEVVVVDDGSTDDTPAVLARVTDPRVRVFRQPENAGRSRTRNRAVFESRGEFVLWLADDDVLVPETLTRYARAIADDPGLDIVYGNLQLFDDGTGEDLAPYVPSDWTGREARLPYAFLHGSVIPDGGTLIRRALYERFGVYDDEFVRAQDYEFWTRLAGHARVRKIEEVVYLYRKHDGNVSFGHGVDLSYDSKIIRRHLARRPLPELFPDFDWSAPERGGSETAAARAWLVVARCLRDYQDPTNAAHFLEAIPGRFAWDEVVERLFDALVCGGALDRAAALVDDYAAWLPRPRALPDALRARLADVREEVGAVARLLAAGRAGEAAARVDALAGRQGPGFDVATLRARICEGRGDDAAAAHHALLALRLKPADDDAAARARALVARAGVRADVDAIRRRLLDDVYPLAPAEPRPSAPRGGGPLVSVVAHPDAVPFALAQAWDDLEVLVEGAGDAQGADPRSSDCGVAADRAPADPRVRAGTLADARGAFVAFLGAGDSWTPDHLPRVMDRLAAGDAVAAFADAWTVALRDGRVVEQASPATFDLGDPVDADRLLTRDVVPLAALVAARDALGDGPDPALGTEVARDLLARLLRRGPVAHVRAATVEALRPSVDDDTRRRDLLALVRRHPLAERGAWYDALRALGVVPARKGSTSVVVIATGDAAALQRCVASVRAHTHVPYDLVLVDPGRDASVAAWVRAEKARDERVRVQLNPRPVNDAKAADQGLALADGERVALLRGDREVPDLWLGRLQWWADEAPDVGAVAAAGAAAVAGADAGAAINRGAAADAGAAAHAGAAADAGVATDADLGCVLLKRGLLERIGGLDPFLGGAADEDFRRRAALAGYRVLLADVVAPGPAAPAPSPEERARLARRPGGPFDREAHFVPFGSEAGFRPDTPPVRVVEAADRNVLVVPPWDDDAALRALLTSLAPGCAYWLRAAPGEAPTCVARLGRLGVPEATVLVVDAHLAPDREAGLYLAADAVYLEETWPDADRVARRASDCGLPALVGADALRAWLATAPARDRSAEAALGRAAPDR